ncbi:DUF6415 family natural product biosynthesis protein [Streptomyces aureus]|uniref:DUF6415 family natural product biosynthesis protein n=1 Tax=Streptomyces aureus TaxID=193461 RepID=UPI00068C6398|nr:DUF6415 family natural product biosynthesis protein [Streptomyces aureus]
MEPAKVERRDHAAAAAETVALVLAEDSPLPDTPEDVEQLATRLRGHISRLGVSLPIDEPVLVRARQLGSAPLPDGFMPSRVHLVRLAEATQELADAVERLTPADRHAGQPAKERRVRPSRNTVRVLVFAIALITLVIAASLPRT